MNDLDLEQRLRTTFQVMAERDIAPWPEPQRVESPRPRRALPLLAGALATVVVVGAIAFAVAYGPRNGHGPSDAMAPPPRRPAHTYIVATSPLGPAERSAVRTTLLKRLHALGAKDPSVRAGRFPATHGTEGFEISAAGVSQNALQTVASAGTFFVRPVLCGAPAFDQVPPIDFPASSLLPSCGAQYLTNQTNLDVTPSTSSAQGYNVNDIPADPSLAHDASTVATADYPGATVLLAADGSSYARLALGPAQMGSSDIAGATAEFANGSGWLIDVQLTPTGVTKWDVVGEENFHQFVALDLDGHVISAPLIEPANRTFASFDGKLVIAGNFSAAQARATAAVINSGPLPVQVTPPTTTTTTTTTIPTAALPTVTISGWTGREPTTIYFSGDAGDVATGLTWSRWDASEGVGQGTRNELSCVPDCAQGTSTPYPVTITMTNPVNGKFTTILEQTSDGRGTTETFTEPYLGQGACTTSAQDSCAF